MGNERTGPVVKVTEWQERSVKAILARRGDVWLGMVRQVRRGEKRSVKVGSGSAGVGLIGKAWIGL